jgi:hypothetical protein
MIFFDSWGAAWTGCAADHPQAEAFGPSGTARPVDREELADRGVDVPYGRTAWGTAFDAGRILLAGEAHQWDTLT